MPPNDHDIPPEASRSEPQAAETDEVRNAGKTGTKRTAGRRVLRWGRRVLVWFIGIVFLFVLSVLLLVQTDRGARKAADVLLGLVDPFDGAELTIGAIEGNWITRLELYDVALTRADSVELAHIDTVQARYDLLGLFTKTLHLRRAYVAGPRVTMTQRADSTWDLLRVFRQDTTTVDTTATGFLVRIDEGQVHRGRFTARYHASGRDSTLHVAQLTTRLDTLLLGRTTVLDVDTLGAFVTPPGRTDSIAVQARARLTDAGQVVLDTLRLDSPASTVAAGGTLHLPTSARDEIHGIDLRLEAAPLAFGELAPFIPALASTGTAQIDAHVEGAASRLRATADARFSDGATLALDALLTPAAIDSVTYRFDAQVRRLNPAFFTGDPSMQGHINADLRGDLHGASLDELAGTARALVFDTRYADYDFDRTILQVRFADGTARIDLETGLRGATLAVDGTVRPFAEPPSYDLQGRVQGFDVGRFTEGTEQSSDVNGTFQVEGHGLNLTAADLTATLDLAASRINRTRVQEGRITARLDEGRLDFRTAWRLPEGRMDLRGDAQLTADPIRYRIAEGTFDNLDVAALAGDTTRSALTGTLSLRGSGTTPTGDLRLDSLQLHLTDSFYGPYQIQRAELDGTLRQGRLNANVSASLDGGSFDLAATARLFDEVPTYEITRGRFDHLDIGRLTQNPDQQSDLTGTITRLSGRGFDPATMALDVAAVLEASQVNQQAIDRADVTATLDQGTVAFEAQLDTPQGQTTLAGSGNLFGDVRAFDLSQGTINGLNVGALLGLPALYTNVNATIRELSVRGSDPQTMTLRARLDLNRSRINRATIIQGRADVTLENGQAQADVDATFQQGRARLTASGRFFDERPTYEAAGTMDSVDVAALAGLDTLQVSFSAAFGIQGEGIDPKTMQAQGRLDAGSARYASIRVDTLHTRFHLEDGLLRVDTLTVRSNVAHAQGGGQIALFDTGPRHRSDLTLTGDVRDPGPLRSLLGAETLSANEGRFEAHASGEPDTLRVEARLVANSMAYNDARLSGLSVVASGTLDATRTLTDATVRAEANYLSVPALTARYTEIEATLAQDTVAFAANVTIDPRRDASLQGTVDLRPDHRRVVLDDLVLHLDRDRWELLQEASIAFGDEYRISNFLLFSEADNQQLAVDGVVDFDGEQSLILTLEQFRTGSVADLFGFEGFGGTLSGYLDLTGPAYAPVLDGTLTLDVESFDQPVGDLRLGVRYDSLRLTLDAVLTHQDQSTLSAAGYLPMDLRLGEGTEGQMAVRRRESAPTSTASFRVQADQFNIGWLEPFLDPERISEIEGQLTADVNVEGTPEDPDLAGTATLQQGRLGLTQLDVTYTRLAAEVEFAADKVELTRAEIYSGGGTVTARGTINMPQLTFGEFDIEATAEGFRAIDSRAYRAVVDADVVLRGTTRSPRLEGSAQVQSADIYLTDETTAQDFEPVRLTERDLQMLERHFGIRVSEADTSTFDFYQALAMDLAIQLERDVWLRSRKNPEMNVQFTGELDVQKEAYADPQVFGSIEVIEERSFINQFGRRFDITQGSLTFNGPATDPQMDIEASYDVRSRSNQSTEITINLSVTGRLDNPTLNLSSEPQTDMTNIVSYLATGRPASQAFQLGGSGSGGVLGQGAGLAIGQVTGIVENAAGAELGLDVIEIRQQGLQGATITAGKYLSRRFYASVSWPVSFTNTSQEAGTLNSNNREFTIEYELFNWLLARVTSSGTTLRFNLLYEFAY